MHWFIPLIIAFFISGCAPQPTLATKSFNDPCISVSRLNSYSYDALAQVALQIREDEKKMNDFSGFINGMKGSVDNYAGMIKSSAYISNAVRFLPVPYAGEVSSTAKLVSGTLLHLNTAASALARYQKSSAYFLSEFDKLNRSSVKTQDLQRIASFADTKMLSDARELQSALQKISSSATAMAAAAQSISDTLDTTGDYVNHAKNYIGLEQSPLKEKSRVDENRNSIKSRLSVLSKNIASLENSAETHRMNIAKASTYTELALQIEKQ